MKKLLLGLLLLSGISMANAEGINAAEEIAYKAGLANPKIELFVDKESSFAFYKMKGEGWKVLGRLSPETMEKVPYGYFIPVNERVKITSYSSDFSI